MDLLHVLAGGSVLPPEVQLEACAQGMRRALDQSKGEAGRTPKSARRDGAAPQPPAMSGDVRAFEGPIVRPGDPLEYLHSAMVGWQALR